MIPASGKHIRHAVDHVNILLNSMSSLPPRVISYDIRIRNTSMESNRQSAKIALLETIANVEEIIPTMNFDEEIVLNAITPYTHTFKTTLGREVSNIRNSNSKSLTCGSLGVVRKSALSSPLDSGKFVDSRVVLMFIITTCRFVSLPENWYVPILLNGIKLQLYCRVSSFPKTSALPLQHCYSDKSWYFVVIILRSP